MALNITHFNTYDVAGGAGKAAYRLHAALRHNGAESKIVSLFKDSADPDVEVPSIFMNRSRARFWRVIERELPSLLYPQRDKTLFSPAWTGRNVSTSLAIKSTDLIHLHWICDGFLTPEALAQFPKPIVWTLHDMWPFTGGCHYDESCGRYVDNCGACPLLKSSKEMDISRRLWERKKNAWQNISLTLVTPSRWLKDQVQKSSLFRNARVEVIPNGLDLNLYQPIEKEKARTELGLPQNKKLVLFSSASHSDSRKGLSFLSEAVARLTPQEAKDIHFVLLGQPSEETNFGTSSAVHSLGYLAEDRMINLAYAACDVLIAPSLQENLANTVLESLAAGTPVLAFNIGGMPDLIEHKKNGYLAKPFDTEDLRAGLLWILETENRSDELSMHAREKAKNQFDIQSVSKTYIQLYRELIS